VVIAVALLAAFVFEKLPKRTQEKGAGREFSKYLTGALILGAVLALVGVLVEGIRRQTAGPLGIVIIGFFAVVFIRIFIDYVKDMRKPKRKRRSRAKGQADGGGDPESNEGVRSG